MKPHEDLKKKVKELISDNKTEKALDLLAEKELPYIGKELILINGRHSKVVDEQRMGISTEEDTQRKFNKINFDLLALIELIGKKPAHNTNSGTSVTNTTGTGDGGKSNTTKYLLIIGGIILAVLAGFAIMHLMEDPATHGIKPVITTSEPTTPNKPDESKVEPTVDTVTSIPAPPPEEEESEDYSNLKIGDEYGGGFVFYIDSDPKKNQHGLIMAPFDISTEDSEKNDHYYWHIKDIEPSKAGAYKRGVYDGAFNTAQIIKEFGEGTYPAKLCDNFDFGDQTDWYLPSQEELNLLYKYYIAKKKDPNLHFKPAYYWSSTEIYYRSFSDGDPFTSLPIRSSFKNQNKAKVRAIRSF